MTMTPLWYLISSMQKTIFIRVMKLFTSIDVIDILEYALIAPITVI